MRAVVLCLLVLAVPLAAQETVVHAIPIGCTSVTVPATPTTPGTVTVTCPPLKLTNSWVKMPAGTAGVPYKGNVAAKALPTGGFPPYVFTLNATPVPPAWMHMSTAGIITGLPTVSGTFQFGFTVTDSSATLAQAAQGTLNVEVANAR